MTKPSVFVFCFITFIGVSLSVQAETQVIRIWPDLAPGTAGAENKGLWTEGKDVSNVYQPDLTVILPEHQTGLTPAVLVFPGGGYRKLVMEKEGYKVARWLNENGIAAFVLKYRLDRKDALRDAQRAVSMIRKDAEKYHLGEHKIGVIGFSAEAHLAWNLVANSQNREDSDSVDAFSSRPDFWAGVDGNYRGISQRTRHASGKQQLPPTFLVHANEDSRAPVLATVQLYTDLTRQGIPAELHVYEHGEHGFALETDRGAAVTSTVTDWSRRFLEWLRVHEVLWAPEPTRELLSGANGISTSAPG